MYKVFFNNNVIFLTSGTVENIECHRKYIFSELDFQKTVPFWLENNLSEIIQVTSGNVTGDWKKFCSWFKFIEAAGGMVNNTEGEYLFIYRRGFWDLPKGKCEKNERPEVCAAREIEEECGIGGVKLEYKLTDTYHTYYHKGNVVLKKTYWYSFHYKGNQVPVPQIEEDITNVKWLGIDEINDIRGKTYSSIIDVIDAG